MPGALTILGVLLLWWWLQGADSPADARHRRCILQADPVHLRLPASLGQNGHFLCRESGW